MSNLKRNSKLRSLWLIIFKVRRKVFNYGNLALSKLLLYANCIVLSISDVSVTQCDANVTLQWQSVMSGQCLLSPVNSSLGFYFRIWIDFLFRKFFLALVFYRSCHSHLFSPLATEKCGRHLGPIQRNAWIHKTNFNG